MKQDNFTPLPKENTCRNFQHNPPSHRVFDIPGVWTCPDCGHKTFIPGPVTF